MIARAGNELDGDFAAFLLQSRRPPPVALTCNQSGSPNVSSPWNKGEGRQSQGQKSSSDFFAL